MKLFSGMVDGLAFLPVDDVSSGMEYLQNNTPDGCEALLEYFDRTYVTGTFRRIQRVRDDGDDEMVAVRVRRIPSLFQPELECQPSYVGW